MKKLVALALVFGAFGMVLAQGVKAQDATDNSAMNADNAAAPADNATSNAAAQ